jgi:hypothetical protein
VSFRTTKLKINEFKNNIKYNKRDLINGKNIIIKKINDNNNSIIFYTGKIDWKIVLSGNLKTR